MELGASLWYNLGETNFITVLIGLLDLEPLETIGTRLQDAGIRLHLSEVKGPVMDRLKRSYFLDELTGQVFLSQHEAARALERKRHTTDVNHPGPLEVDFTHAVAQQ